MVHDLPDDPRAISYFLSRSIETVKEWEADKKEFEAKASDSQYADLWLSLAELAARYIEEEKQFIREIQNGNATIKLPY